MRIEKLCGVYRLEPYFTGFPLHPEIPPEGMLLSELLPGVDLDAVYDRLAGIARELNLPLVRRERTWNSRKAQELGKWAESRGRGRLFHAAVYHACFGKGEDISDPQRLVRIAASVGLPAEEADEVLRSDRFAPAVDGDWEKARNLNVRAVPTFLFEGRRLVGFQSVDAFHAFLES